MAKTTPQKIRSLRAGWAVWLFPVLALIICGYLFYDSVQKRGPSIKILFSDASGLQAEKTQVRSRGVSIGYVKSVVISEDTKDVGVTFRGLNVGSVTKVTLNKSAQVAIIQLNIQNRYVKLIRTNTVFWRKVGIQADLRLFGSKVKINSLESVMKGGIEFFTPDEVGERAKWGSRFSLNATAPKGSEKWNPAIN